MAVLQLSDRVPKQGLRINGKIVSCEELLKNADKYRENGYAHYFIELQETKEETESQGKETKRGRPPKQ